MTKFHSFCKELGKDVCLSIVVFIACFCKIKGCVSCAIIVVLTIPCTLHEVPEIFHRIGMNFIAFPFIRSIECFVFHFLTDLVVVTKMIGNEFYAIGLDRLIDKLKYCFSSEVWYELCDDLSTSFNSS